MPRWQKELGTLWREVDAYLAFYALTSRPPVPKVADPIYIRPAGSDGPWALLR